MKSLKLFVAAALLISVPTSAHAQRVGSIRLGMSGGGTVALHDVAPNNSDGFNFGIHAIMQTGLPMLALKLEGLRNQLGKNQSSEAAKTLVTSAGLSVELTPGSIPLFLTPARGPAIAPFFSLGAGAYHIQSSVQSALENVGFGVAFFCPTGGAGCAPSFPLPDRRFTTFGWNAGGGLRIPIRGVDTFIEAQYHHISTRGSSFLSRSISFAPLSVGLTF